MPPAFIRLQRKGQMVLPRRLREMTGIAEGTLLKVDVLKGPRFLVTPQFTIDHPMAENSRKNRKQLLRDLAGAVDELRQDAKAKGLDKMPMREIRAAVTAARRDLKTRSKQPSR